MRNVKDDSFEPGYPDASGGFPILRSSRNVTVLSSERAVAGVGAAVKRWLAEARQPAAARRQMAAELSARLVGIRRRRWGTERVARNVDYS